jgi:16S rRNA (cytidine1402-2'-O)-methyltransferase
VKEKDIALISDAGTPLISDPGNELIQHLISKNFNIVSIPGPSSVLTALTVSGFEINEFQFLGFIPKAGKERSEFLVRLFNSEIPTVCFTSPKRLLKDLGYFEKEGLDSELVICRELTKKFETIYRGTAESLKNKISENIKGEITIVVAPSKKNNNIDLDLDKAIGILLEQKVPKRELAKTLSLVTDISVNDLYERVKDL